MTSSKLSTCTWTSSMLDRLMPFLFIAVVLYEDCNMHLSPYSLSMQFQLVRFWEDAALVTTALLLLWKWLEWQLQVGEVSMQASLEALCCEAVCRGPLLLLCSAVLLLRWTPQVNIGFCFCDTATCCRTEKSAGCFQNTTRSWLHT